MKNKIIEILDYLADEETHFWESCNCDIDGTEKSSYKDCECEQNKNHIWRIREEVREEMENKE